MNLPDDPASSIQPPASSIQHPATSIEQTAAASREATLERDTLGHFWQGQRLQKWNARREIHFLALERRALEIRPHLEGVCNNLDYLPILEAKITEIRREAQEAAAQNGVQLDADDDADIQWARFYPAAARVLWLAHHDIPVNLAGNFETCLDQIDAWADEHIGDAIESAVRLAHLLRTEHRQFVAIPRPEKTHGGNSAGN